MKASVLFLVILLQWGCAEEASRPTGDSEAGSQAAQSIDSVASATLVRGSQAEEPPTQVFLTYEQRQGKHLYMKYCAVCHGEQGKGDGFNAFNLDPKPRDFTDARYMNALSDARLRETVTEGGRGVNRSALMPSWGGRLSKDEIEFVVSYIRHFSAAD